MVRAWTPREAEYKRADLANSRRIFYFSGLPFIFGDAVLFYALGEDKGRRRGKLTALFFWLYEIILALAFVYTLLFRFCISNGLLDWKSDVRASARGF